MFFPSIRARERIAIAAGKTMAELMTIEVAELIEQGLDLAARGSDGLTINEDGSAWIEIYGSSCRANALGFALIGRFGGPRAAAERWAESAHGANESGFEAAAELIGIPPTLARLIALVHKKGAPAAVIARNLRAGSVGLLLDRRSNRSEFVGREQPARPQPASKVLL
jgi:hypothetical protein